MCDRRCDVCQARRAGLIQRFPKYQLRYTRLFEQDLMRAAQYIDQVLDNPTAAQKLVDDTEKAILERLNLSLNGYATMRQLAGEFDVSINTIQRDITYLARYYPLETAYGRYGGGVYFEQNWQPYRIYMTPLQERALQHAISSAAAEDVVPLQEILQTFARK